MEDQNGNEIKKYFDPPHDTYYRAKLEIFSKDYKNGAGGWLTKPTQEGYSSTFFPDWTKQKLQQELALAWGNKKYFKYSQYTGEMSDGVRVRFYLRNDIITSAHPDL
ncbi:EndoU nuclease-like protein [Pedobacter psychrotolerans]|uniref:EndoU nuclease-like protein n=1 Tax=Pedobacter psychrotolerans TaxID=1843235 RepID=A0A4R2GZE2_9SPHI|nr:EndoU nuclease-like protein [Pedobacter psychrotolerans]GGE71412.1 hypothetical protein GCM10011413_42720 [Pedobacter psychrotolerans]